MEIGHFSQVFVFLGKGGFTFLLQSPLPEGGCGKMQEKEEKWEIISSRSLFHEMWLQIFWGPFPTWAVPWFQQTFQHSIPYDSQTYQGSWGTVAAFPNFNDPDFWPECFVFNSILIFCSVNPAWFGVWVYFWVLWEMSCWVLEKLILPWGSREL